MPSARVRARSPTSRVTQQNAALVEQAAAASKSMDDQAGKLRSAASIFKLPGGALHAQV
jgi:methyl-accepting chemotaxis protein